MTEIINTGSVMSLIHALASEPVTISYANTMKLPVTCAENNWSAATKVMVSRNPAVDVSSRVTSHTCIALFIVELIAACLVAEFYVSETFLRKVDYRVINRFDAS